MSSHADSRACFYRNLESMAGIAPEAVQAFMGLHQATMAPKALDTKTKELIALAIAIAVHCDICIDCHVHDAIEAGVSLEEVADVIAVAILMGGGPSVAYSTKVLEAFDEYTGA